MAREEPKPTSCCGMPVYAEPVYFYVENKPGKRRFAEVHLCCGCRRVLTAAPRLDNSFADPSLKEIQKHFNATSWLMMKQSHPQPPYNFHLGTAGVLIPEHYKGDVKIQADFNEPKEN